MLLYTPELMLRGIYFVQVEVLQKKFDDFKTDLQANEVRLAEMNEIAMQLMSLGQTEAALKIQTQIQELNSKWNSLQQMAQVKKQDHFWALLFSDYQRYFKQQGLFGW